MENNSTVLDKIKNFNLDNPESKFCFSDRLARENGWSKDYANRVINEYKLFIYLSYITGKSLTPSDEVDQAWHLHLIYSHSYWVDFCQETLGGFKLHHGPTKGGVSESKKYTEQYEYTLKIYTKLIGNTPPTDIWPNVEARFKPVQFKRIDTNNNYVINKQKVKEYMSLYILPFIGFISLLLFMSNTSSDASPDTKSIEAGEVILWILGIILGIFIIRGVYRFITRNDRKKTNSSTSSDGCTVASSFFGCGGCSTTGCGSGDSGCGSSGCSGCGGD